MEPSDPRSSAAATTGETHPAPDPQRSRALAHNAHFDKFVLTVATFTDRHAKFRAENAHLGRYSFHYGIPGAELAAQGLRHPRIAPGIRWRTGALANALDHMAIWQICTELKRPVIVLEDDARTVKDFEVRIDQGMQDLPEDWDIVLLGFNYDAYLHIDFYGLPSGTARVAFNQDQLQKDWPLLDGLSVRPFFHRLRVAWGISAYLLSPKGAARLLDLIPQLSAVQVAPPRGGFSIHADTIDGMMNGIYCRIGAYCSLPPLAFVQNDHGVSKIRRGSQG